MKMKEWMTKKSQRTIKLGEKQSRTWIGEIEEESKMPMISMSLWTKMSKGIRKD
jgi:hypothetical protein